jgi:tetratricopeptide (TPR) repeat protein
MRITKLHLIVSVVLLVIVTILPLHTTAKEIPFTAKTPEVITLLLQGLEKSDGLQFREARDLFQKAIATDPECAIAYYFLATSANSNEEYLAAFRKAVELAPKASEPEQVLIQIAQAGINGKPNEVAELTKKLVALVPESPRAHSYLSNNLRARKEYAGAEAESRKAIELDPKYAPAYNDLAYILADLGRYPEAIDALKKYSALRPTDPNPHDSMAEIYLWMGDHKNSIAEYGSSLALDPKFSGSIYGLGNNYVLMGQYDKAREAYDSWLKQAKDFNDTALVFTWRAVSYIHEGKPDDVIKTWLSENAFAIAHQDPYGQLDAHLNLANFYQEIGNYAQSLDECLKTCDLAQDSTIPTNIQVGYLRSAIGIEAVVLACQGKPAEAQVKITELKKITEPDMTPTLSQFIHLIQGEVAFYSNDITTALAEFAQADPQNAEGKYLVAECYEKQGKTKEAKELYTWITKWNRNGYDLGVTRPKALKKIM